MPQGVIHIERELLRQVATGNETAFRELFDRYNKRFYAAALKMTRSTHTAQEIVQEVFVTLWLKRQTLDTVENPPAYLFTIVYNSIYTHFKKLATERRMKAIAGERAEEWEQPVDEWLFAKENQQLLQKAIDQLPPQQQQVYKLSKQEGLSRDAIAERLKISPHTVKNHLQEALKSIRAQIGNSGALLISLIISQRF